MENNLSDFLQKGIASAQLDLIHRVAGQASTLGLPVYIVGGFVRDLLLERPSLDFDLVVEGDAIALAQTLVSRYGGTLTVHGKFRTVKWFIDDNACVDLISARSETYKHPAALPTVKLGTIHDDLRRRDFTINTLAIRLDGNHFGRLYDEFEGLNDLQQGLIRVLHLRSFADDPTRMYRAVRYEKRYGFNVVDETLALIPEARGLIQRLSAQRIRHELDLILDEPYGPLMIARLGELELLKSIHPALKWDKSTQGRLKSRLKTQHEGSKIALRDLHWLLWLMTLSPMEISSLNQRLHFTAPLMESLIASSKLHSDSSALVRLKPSQCVEKLDKLPIPAISAVFIASPQGKPKQMLENYLSAWRYIKPKTTGHDLIKLGLEPGPKYQSTLKRLRNAWLDGEVHDVGEEQKLLRKMLH